MIKKEFHGKMHRVRPADTNGRWFFYGINDKKKKIKPQTQSKKSKIWSFVFLAVNILVVACVLAYQINSEDGVSSIKNLFNSNNNYTFLILSILCFLVAELMIACRLNFFCCKYDKRSNFRACIKSEFICQYYSKLMPFAIGGQPFQVYVLNRHGVKAHNAVTMVSCNYIAQKLVHWIISLFMMLTIATNDLVKQLSGASFKVVLVMAWISISFLTVYLLFVILACVNKKIASNLVSAILKLLNKIKIVKNKKLLYFKIMRPTLAFQHKVQEYFKSKQFAWLTLIWSIICYLIQMAIPACIYFIFKPFNWLYFWQLMSISTVIQLSFGVNPIPGGSGVAEISFYAVFILLIPKKFVFWALILWRILTYYVYIVVGLGITIYDYVYGNRRAKRILKQMQKN